VYRLGDGPISINVPSPITRIQQMRTLLVQRIGCHDLERGTKETTNVSQELDTRIVTISEKFCGIFQTITDVRRVGSPIRHRATSSLPRTIMRRTSVWCCRSTQPPLSISARSARVAWRAISSGATPGWEIASEQCNAEVVDSARRLNA
jgi:hypothetical protein